MLIYIKFFLTNIITTYEEPCIIKNRFLIVTKIV
jgi:hypothetical protein